VFLVIFGSYSSSQGRELTVWGNRYYQDSDRITRTEFKSLLSTQAGSLEMWKSASTFEVLSVVSYVAAVPLYFGSFNRGVTRQSGQLMRVSAVGVLVVSSILSASSARLRREAVLSYNAGQDCISFRVGTTQNGVGLIASF